MPGRSFQFSCVLALVAATAFGCATGSTEDGTLPPGGDETGVDSSAGGDAEADTGGGGGDAESDTSGGADTGSGGDSTTDGPSGCDPDAGLTISCGVGECTVTVNACKDDGTPNTCKPKDPGTETCNGKDDDCDGMVDEELGDIECGVGECKVTQKKCIDGKESTCTPKPPGVEICNAKDDDCDGMIDDGFETVTCGVGECKNTVSSCMGGGTVTCMPKPAGVEICNGKDDDCDGTVDDDIAPITCGSGICANSAPGCVDGAPGVCIPKDLGVTSCGTGECLNFVSVCVGGVPQTCTPKPAGTEVCDGKDNDCNGPIDDGPSATLCPPPASGKVATTSCESAKCKIAACDLGWADADGTYANGCECADDSPTGKTCATSYDFSTVGVGSSKTVTMKNPVATRDDWYRIQFLNARSNTLASPRVTLTMPGFTGAIPFVIEIQQSTCSGTIPGSCTEGGSATNRTSWSARFNSVTGSYGQPNWKPFLAGSGEHAIIYVKVSYKAGAATTCHPYTLTIEN